MAHPEVELEQQLLLQHSTVMLPAIERFAVAEVIVAGNTIGAHTIACVCSNFAEHFGDVVEENVPAAEIRSWTLIERSLDKPIIKTLGGKKKIITPIARMIQVIELGTQGPGLFDGYANIHYRFSPKTGKLWALIWQCDGTQLRFSADPFSYPCWWTNHDRVFGG